jgi:hypothetical protein
MLHSIWEWMRGEMLYFPGIAKAEALFAGHLLGLYRTFELARNQKRGINSNTRTCMYLVV